MLRKRQGQLDLAHSMPRTEIGRELGAMPKVLDGIPKIYEVAYQDLIGLKDPEIGRAWTSAEQVVRAAILKQYRSLSYEEQAFHLDDSASFRVFARLSRGQRTNASTPQKTLRCRRPPQGHYTRAMIEAFLGFAAKVPADVKLSCGNL